MKTIVCGALGKTGRAVVTGLAREREIDLAGGVAPHAVEEYLDLPNGGGLIPLARDTETLLRRVKPRAVVDFTNAEAALANARLAIRYGASPIIGTSGLSEAARSEIDRLAREAGIGAVLAPNFAIGSALQLHFARIASRFFDAVEIVEMHHDGKADAPSGTALATAHELRAAKGEDFNDPATTKLLLQGVRGGETGGVRVHSLRLPGLVAHQEIIFGGQGQILTIRHDSLSRDSFVAGVVLATKAAATVRGLVVGLDKLMGFE
ncbi:MAG: 4-hydroxy-tetrahydrodipicolinate reductase [Chloroflexi bacterium]|nr:4-hydroxy-tetrahydrodipicolinate reductase [Chloroflexota bacterium]